MRWRKRLCCGIGGREAAIPRVLKVKLFHRFYWNLFIIRAV
jgi:hypothetical protein